MSSGSGETTKFFNIGGEPVSVVEPRKTETVWIGGRPRAVTPPRTSPRNRDDGDTSSGGKSPRLDDTSSPGTVARRMLAPSELRGTPVSRGVDRKDQDTASRGGRNQKRPDGYRLTNEVATVAAVSDGSGGLATHQPRVPPFPISSPSASAGPEAGQADEARRVFQQFEEKDRRCMCISAGEQCTERGVEAMTVSGNVVFRGSMVTWNGMGFYCAIHAWGAVEGLLNKSLNGITPNLRTQALIGLRAGQRAADIEAQDQSLAALRMEIAFVEARNVESERRRVLAETESKMIAEVAASKVQTLQARAEAAEIQTRYVAETAEQQVRNVAAEVRTQAIHEVQQRVGQVEEYAERVAVEANMRVRSEAEEEVISARRLAEEVIERERSVMRRKMVEFEREAKMAMDEAERVKKDTWSEFDAQRAFWTRAADDRVRETLAAEERKAIWDKERETQRWINLEAEMGDKERELVRLQEEQTAQRHELEAYDAQQLRARVSEQRSEAQRRLESAQLAALQDRIRELEVESKVATNGWHESMEVSSVTSAQERRAELYEEEAKREKAAREALEQEN